MKKALFTLLLLVAAATAGAQEIVKGDMNNDDQLTVADVTSLVDVVIGRSPKQAISLGVDPYKVDNTLVIGTWYAPDGTSFTLNEGGTTTYPGAATYKFRPNLGSLLFFNPNGVPVKKLTVEEVEPARYLLTMDYSTNTFTCYTGEASLATGITLDQTSLSMNSGTTAQLTATISPDDAIATITWTSSDESVATVDHNGLVTAVAGGTCTITATANASGKTATCEVTVNSTAEQHAYVDLGLPSGTLWATCNVGATSPEDYGDYFAWGETTGYNDGKTTFDWSTYKWCNGSSSTMTKYCNNSNYGYNGFTDNKTELDLEDDAAYVNWGAAWRMPSYEQFKELTNSSYTTTAWTTQNGVGGRLITSNSNGNSVFLPAAGYRYGSSLDGAGSYGGCLSRTLDESGPDGAHGLGFISSGVNTGYGNRYYGQSVRPVRSTE